ncbi:TonB-dependent siderophore receptor [Malaciobacter mytili]|uniref:TonB-dependent siderophore receptor n=1 Tax=Malaciobacter mytili TaxID=603050 RepID=UPI00100B6C04|nr:TonB-dependent receptor [Malaciobacter mytili]RXI43370.1 TonB-dependent siderophore receptor [Malaciobacter mytili]
MKIVGLQRKLSITLCSLLFASSSLFAKDKEQTKQLDSITILEKTTADYQNKKKINLARNNIDIEEMAKSVQVYNEDFIKDYQPQNINDIVTMSSNTTYLGDNHGRENKFAIRGFAGVPVLRDGFNLSNSVAYPELFNLERVEILKGPDSLQYGEANPGGLINLVHKKPQKEFHAQTVFEYTSNKSYSPKLDVGGSLNKDGSLRYRLVSVYKTDEGVKDYNNDAKKIFIAPSIAYDIDDNNTITFISEYLNERKQSDFGAYVKSDGTLATSTKTVTSHPDETLDKLQKIYGFELQSNYNSWNSLLRYRYIDYEIDNHDVHIPFVYNEAANTLSRFYASQRNQYKDNILQYTLNKEIDIFNLRNRFTIGADYRKSSSKFRGYMDRRTLYTINLSNPTYEKLTSKDDHPQAITYGNTGETIITRRVGGFLQDHINLTDNLILSAGVRYDRVTPQNSQKSSKVLPQVGLVYKLSNQTTLYANYSESFYPQTALDKNGKLLDPEEGKGIELGVKQKLFNDNFDLTAAIFKIQKENIATTDETNPLFSVASEEQESRGFEIDLAGEIISGWSLVASYGYTKTEDKGKNEGKLLAGIPKHTFNLFTTYNLNSFGLPNTFIGGGARYIGSRYADTTNSVKLDSNIIYNATLGYKKGHWSANLSLHNITDEEYVESASTSRVYIGTPRAVVATLSYSF